MTIQKSLYTEIYVPTATPNSKLQIDVCEVGTRIYEMGVFTARRGSPNVNLVPTMYCTPIFVSGLDRVITLRWHHVTHRVFSHVEYHGTVQRPNSGRSCQNNNLKNKENHILLAVEAMNASIYHKLKPPEE